MKHMKNILIALALVAVVLIHNEFIPPHIWPYFYNIENLWVNFCEVWFGYEDEPFQKIA